MKQKPLSMSQNTFHSQNTHPGIDRFPCSEVS